MKSISIALAVLSAIAIVPVARSATALQSDESLRQYERKVQMQIADIGMLEQRVTLPVLYCALEAKACIPKGAWSYSIDKNLQDKTLSVLMEQLSGSRFDQLNIKPDGISIKTLAEIVDVKANIGAFQFETGSFDAFKSKVDSYLNQEIAPLMTKILAKAKDARYQEMKEKERATFLAEIAKETSVPANVLEKLMSSAFVFSYYVHQASGSATITEIKFGDVSVINTSFALSLPVTVVIHHYDPGISQFTFYKEIKGDSGLSSASGRALGAFPGQSSSRDLFERSYLVATKAAGINMKTTLKEDDNFSIYSTVDDVNGGRFYSAVGEYEDLRVDAPYNIFQTTEDGLQHTGWGKVQTVASSQTFQEKPVDYLSEFDLVSGSVEYKDQLREHPWTGVFFSASGAMMPYNVKKIDEVEYEGGGNFVGLNFAFLADLGYLLNSRMLSEKWLEFNFLLAGGGEDLQTGNNVINTSPSAYYYGLDIVHRYNLGSGIYAGFKYGVGEASLSASGTGTFSDMDIKSSVARLGAQAGYMLSPNTTFFANLDYYAPFGGEATGGTSETTVDAEISGGLGFSAGITYHIKAIGGFASMMR